MIVDDVSSANVAQASGTSMLSGMFNFMKHPRGSNQQVVNTGEGVYLAELETGAIEPEVAALYFPSHAQGSSSNQNGDYFILYYYEYSPFEISK